MVLRFAGCTIKRLEESSLFILSRGDKIRTCDLCVPNAALYQTEPRDDFVNTNRINIKIINKNPLIVKQKTNMIEEKVAKTIKPRN